MVFAFLPILISSFPLRDAYITFTSATSLLEVLSPPQRLLRDLWAGAPALPPGRKALRWLPPELLGLSK